MTKTRLEIWTLEEETDKAEVVAAFGGTQFIQFRAALEI